MINYAKQAAMAKEMRKQYPVGTRLMVEEMKDPFAPVPSGTVGSVALINDIGQIHMEWDNGRTLPLVPGVDRFFEVQTRKFSTPLIGAYRRDHYQDDVELDPIEDADYLRPINKAIDLSLDDLDNIHRGLAEYLDEDDALYNKVYSVIPSVVLEHNRLVGVMTCELREALSESETTRLLEYISGQLADGWGEGFEQQDIQVYDGELQVSFWARGKECGNTFTEVIGQEVKKYEV